jgi:trimeric autotransporter adhesin
VPDPNDLPDLIPPNLIGSTLTKVEMTVDGGAPTAVTTVPPTPQPGSAMVAYSTTAGLNPGSHDICVTAFGTDVTGGSADVTTCVTVKVYDLVLAPATATNNLGGGDNSHTVTATLQGPAGAVGGYLVTFSVGGQNAGETGTCVPVSCQTNAAGVVTFTYDVDIDPSSLGVDTIAASVTLASPTGATDTETVTKE